MVEMRWPLIRPDPAGGAYNAPTDSLAGRRRGEGKGKGREGTSERRRGWGGGMER